MGTAGSGVASGTTVGVDVGLGVRVAGIDEDSPAPQAASRIKPQQRSGNLRSIGRCQHLTCVNADPDGPEPLIEPIHNEMPVSVPQEAESYRVDPSISDGKVLRSRTKSASLPAGQMQDTLPRNRVV